MTINTNCPHCGFLILDLADTTCRGCGKYIPTAEFSYSYDQMDLAYARECLKEKDEKIARLEARIEELESDKWALEKQIDYLLENGCEPGSGVALIIEKRPDLVGVKE